MKPADPAAHAKLKELHQDLSSGAAEIYAASVTLTEVPHLSYICEEMGFQMDPLFTIHIDNTTAIAFSEGSVQKSKLKHIDVRQNWVKWLRGHELCKLKYVDTKSNLADFYTKALDTETFRRLRDRQMASRPLPAAAAAWPGAHTLYVCVAAAGCCASIQVLGSSAGFAGQQLRLCRETRAGTLLDCGCARGGERGSDGLGPGGYCCK